MSLTSLSVLEPSFLCYLHNSKSQTKNKSRLCSLRNARFKPKVLAPTSLHLPPKHRRFAAQLSPHPDAKGRYNCSSNVITIEEMAEFLSAKFPEFQIPSSESRKEVEGHKFPALSSKKLLHSGFEFKYGVDEMFSDAIHCCKEKGYL